MKKTEFEELLRQKQCDVISIPIEENFESQTTTEHCKPSIGEKDAIVISNLASVVDVPDVIDNDLIYVAFDTEYTLHENEIEPTSIEKDKVNRHYYFIDNNVCVKLKSLYITVVFSGDFEGAEYKAGKIDVCLKRLSVAREPIAHLQIGTITIESQNSMTSFGIITIECEQKDKVIESGMIELTITAKAATRYSIRVLSGSFARCVELELKKETTEILENERKIEECKSKHQSLYLQRQLLERKIKAVTRLQDNHKASLDKCKMKSAQLEEDLGQSSGTEEEDSLLLRKIDALSIEHKHILSRNLQKEDMRQDLISELEKVTMEIGLNLEDEKRLTKEVREGKAIVAASQSRLGFGTRVPWDI